MPRDGPERCAHNLAPGLNEPNELEYEYRTLPADGRGRAAVLCRLLGVWQDPEAGWALYGWAQRDSAPTGPAHAHSARGQPQTARAEAPRRPGSPRGHPGQYGGVPRGNRVTPAPVCPEISPPGLGGSPRTPAAPPVVMGCPTATVVPELTLPGPRSPAPSEFPSNTRGILATFPVDGVLRTRVPPGFGTKDGAGTSPHTVRVGTRLTPPGDVDGTGTMPAPPQLLRRVDTPCGPRNSPLAFRPPPVVACQAASPWSGVSPALHPSPVQRLFPVLPPSSHHRRQPRQKGHKGRLLYPPSPGGALSPVDEDAVLVGAAPLSPLRALSPHRGRHQVLSGLLKGCPQPPPPLSGGFQ